MLHFFFTAHEKAEDIFKLKKIIHQHSCIILECAGWESWHLKLYRDTILKSNIFDQNMNGYHRALLKMIPENMRNINFCDLRSPSPAYEKWTEESNACKSILQSALDAFSNNLDLSIQKLKTWQAKMYKTTRLRERVTKDEIEKKYKEQNGQSTIAIYGATHTRLYAQ